MKIIGEVIDYAGLIAALRSRLREPDGCWA
jgi:hypothetical protein